MLPQAKTRHVQLLGNPPPEKALFSSGLLFLVPSHVLILGLNAVTGGCFQPLRYPQLPCLKGWVHEGVTMTCASQLQGEDHRVPVIARSVI